jgi:lipopolysaccharide transport protein LptA
MISQTDVSQQEFCMSKIVRRWRIVLLAVMFSPGNAIPMDESNLEMINISADEAYEDIQPGTLYFKGHFLMQSHEWRLESERAAVYGPPDKPNKVYLEGAPARFLISRNEGEGQLIVEAEAPAMEYLRSTNVLELTGGALLKLDNEVIRSSVIKYDIGNNRYWSGGIDGVMIEVLPVD